MQNDLSFYKENSLIEIIDVSGVAKATHFSFHYHIDTEGKLASSPNLVIWIG